MGEPVFFTTPNGERMAILAQEDYEALVEASEETADHRAIDRFNDRFSQAEEEFLPSECVQRMIDGESPVRVWRDYRQLSLAMLANAAGIDVVVLADIENRTVEPDVGTLKRIAEILRLSLDDLA